MDPSIFLPYGDVKSGELLKKHTSFRIGGGASCFVEPHSTEDLAACLRLCRERALPYFILGNGSNLLVSDEGIGGVVLHVGKGLSHITVTGNTVTAGAGARLTDVCREAAEASLTGLEFAYGIPGSVGGGVFMNAGAYGGELCQVLETVTVLTAAGQLVTLGAGDCDLSYRHSRFMEDGSVVVEASFALTPGDRETILSRMADILGRRKDKQPLEWPSAGSVFRRPEGYFAGALIEGAGLKGYAVGDAQVSEKHAGFIINKGNATAKDVRELIRHIQRTVREKDGVELVCEIRFVE